MSILMKKSINIAQVFPKHLFWDMDLDKLDFIEDMAIIIPRALYATTSETFEDDILKLEEIYDRSEIVSNLQNTKQNISNMICRKVSERYNIPTFSRYSLAGI